MDKVDIKNIVNSAIVSVLKASGITENQAKLCVLYALCTYQTSFSKMPILAVIGMTGTGKSALVEQLILLVNEPKLSAGKTYATVRDEMSAAHKRTYLCHEADDISEQLLLQRTDSTMSDIEHKVQLSYGWKSEKSNIFGATILARRNPFKDAAVRNRAIVIKTKKQPGAYACSVVPGFKEIAQQLKVAKTDFGKGRVEDTWAPLISVAQALDDPNIEQVIKESIEAESIVFRSGQEYEPSQLVAFAMDKLTWDFKNDKRLDADILLTEVTEAANELGDVKLSNKEVELILIDIDFKVTFTHGVKYVRSNPELISSLV